MSGIEQYSYFALYSDELTAAHMAEALGLEPDEVSVRGSRMSDPIVPASHKWAIVSQGRGLHVDEHVTNVLERIAPVADAVRQLTASGEVVAALQIVRYFDSEAGKPAPIIEVYGEHGLEMGPTPNYLLGWSLTAEQITLLAHTRAFLDTDEYA